MKGLIIVILLLAASVTAFSQEKVVCPAGLFCLDQKGAQVAFDNAKELPLVKEKVAVLEQALKDKDASIAEVRATAAKNESDLKNAIHRTELETARLTGQLTASEAEKVRLLTLLDFAIKNTKKKRNAFITIF